MNMASGNWLDYDGLFHKFGTSLADPEGGGEYQSPGESRTLEFLLDLGTGGQTVLGGPTAGPILTATPSIISYTTMFPLQTTALTTATQFVFLEQVEVETLVGMVANGATALNIGLICVNRATPPAFVVVTPNNFTQLVNGLPNAAFTTTGQKVLLNDSPVYGTYNGTTYMGTWIGNLPLVTNVISPLPTHAFVGAQAVGGTGYTSGLLKIRAKYNIYGTIQY
jgi:hypothetical protein